MNDQSTAADRSSKPCRSGQLELDMGAIEAARRHLGDGAVPLSHGDLLARRIVQLGGSPDFSPDTPTQRSHAAYDELADWLED